jgi:hypothetical protein
VVLSRRSYIPSIDDVCEVCKINGVHELSTRSQILGTVAKGVVSSIWLVLGSGQTKIRPEERSTADYIQRSNGENSGLGRKNVGNHLRDH